MAKLTVEETTIPSAAPDYAGQFHLDTTTKVPSVAIGSSVLGDWLRLHSEKLVTASVVTGDLDLDLEKGNLFYVALGENATLNIINPNSSTTIFQSLRLIVKQDGTGGRDLTMSDTVYMFEDGLEIETGSGTDADAVNFYEFSTFDGGSTYIARALAMNVQLSSGE